MPMPSNLTQYLELARGLDREAFLSRFPNPVLVRRSESQSLAPRDEYSSTLRMRIDRSTREVRIEPVPSTPLDKVTPVVKSDRNSFASKVLVGRTETNDLVVSHMTVTKHHAFFSSDEHTGRTLLTDTGSTNGTQLNGELIEARQPRMLTDGDRVAFGDIQFVFYTAGGFYDLLLSLSALR